MHTQYYALDDHFEDISDTIEDNRKLENQFEDIPEVISNMLVFAFDHQLLK